MVPLDWSLHSAPPSSVRTMVPPEPTAVPVLASTKETPSRFSVVPLDWDVQVVPPSVVRRMVPRLPTATTVLRFGAATAKRSFPCGSGFCQNQPDCAKDVLVPSTATTENRSETREGATFMAFPLT